MNHMVIVTITFLNLGFFLPIENYRAEVFFLLHIFPITLKPLHKWNQCPKITLEKNVKTAKIKSAKKV